MYLSVCTHAYSQSVYPDIELYSLSLTIAKHDNTYVLCSDFHFLLFFVPFVYSFSRTSHCQTTPSYS